MSDCFELICVEPAEPVRLAVRQVAALSAKDNEVVVRMQASSVNPIDAKRATGYGRRLLRIKGASRFPLVMGNDVMGVVESVGRGVDTWRPGDRVFGLVPTGPRGAHASQVAVDARWLRPAIDDLDAGAQAVLPYTFTTMWQTLRGAGITPENAARRNVLVHGASGGLGQLALQVLARWGATVTAICSTANVERCEALGAANVWDRTEKPLSALPQTYDATLNFGVWQDEGALLSRLKDGALGSATAVHPMLANFDRLGWLAGAWRCYRDFGEMRSRASARGARYGWVVFQPDEAALDALHALLLERAVSLPVGVAVALGEGERAFDHVARQCAGRAVLLA